MSSKVSPRGRSGAYDCVPRPRRPCVAAPPLALRRSHRSTRMTPGIEISGVGMTPFGRFEDRTVTPRGLGPGRAALREACDPAFGAAFCGTAYSGVAAGHRVLGRLGRTGIPIVDVEAGARPGAARRPAPPRGPPPV